MELANCTLRNVEEQVESSCCRDVVWMGGVHGIPDLQHVAGGHFLDERKAGLRRMMEELAEESVSHGVEPKLGSLR